MEKYFWKVKFVDGETYQVWAATVKTAIELGVFGYNKEHSSCKTTSADICSVENENVFQKDCP